MLKSSVSKDLKTKYFVKTKVYFGNKKASSETNPSLCVLVHIPKAKNVLSYNNLPESQLDDYFNQSYQFKFNTYFVIG